jgi:hypothetical protein
LRHEIKADGLGGECSVRGGDGGAFNILDVHWQDLSVDGRIILIDVKENGMEGCAAYSSGSRQG